MVTFSSLKRNNQNFYHVTIFSNVTKNESLGEILSRDEDLNYRNKNGEIPCPSYYYKNDIVKDANIYSAGDSFKEYYLYDRKFYFFEYYDIEEIK